MDVPINYLGVILAAVASMVVGAVWYAKPVFGATWQKALGLKDEQMQAGAAKAMAGAFVLALVTAYVLAHTIELSHAYFQYSYLTNGLTTAFFLWLGIQATSTLTHYLFEQGNKTLTVLRIFHDLTSLLVMGTVLALVR
jgi:hypothetical protein